MQIVDVEQLLAQHDQANPLRPISLAVLDPRREPYQALLCQPQGTIHASHNRIGNPDSATSEPMYLALLQEAVTRQSQLVMTPEYSVPWSVIGEIARGALRPPLRSLWALGSESITPDELEAFHASFANQNGIRLMHEPIDRQQRAQKSFIGSTRLRVLGANAGRRNHPMRSRSVQNCAMSRRRSCGTSVSLPGPGCLQIPQPNSLSSTHRNYLF